MTTFRIREPLESPRTVLHPIICWRYMLCPVTVSFLRQSEKNIFKETVSTVDWKALYLFGVRVAAWRVT